MLRWKIFIVAVLFNELPRNERNGEFYTVLFNLKIENENFKSHSYTAESGAYSFNPNLRYPILNPKPVLVRFTKNYETAYTAQAGFQPVLRIRCFFTPWIRDPDPGWKNVRIRIRDEKMFGSGFGIKKMFVSGIKPYYYGTSWDTDLVGSNGWRLSARLNCVVGKEELFLIRYRCWPVTP
jgi:hypothetical protein